MPLYFLFVNVNFQVPPVNYFEKSKTYRKYVLEIKRVVHFSL
jgi:hypothetical protein